ncbi:MAG: VWA domain-containing protein [Phycisphaeraceae bacterium]|nr:VWA domain-containing protein [Phycisphaeraceae bacterium]
MSAFSFEQAWWLLLLFVIPLFWLRPMNRAWRASVVLPGASALRQAGAASQGLLVRVRWLLPLLRSLAAALLVIGLARPVKANEQTRIFVEGIAIQIVVDRSGSMQAMDFARRGREMDRLDAVKLVATEFIAGGEGLKGRPNDLIGLVTFARFADSLSPPTLDHDYVIDVLRRIRPAGPGGEDGTAIGDGVALAVERLRGLGDDRSVDSTRRIKSRVIILLTDGENNAGDIDPMLAAEMAKALGIRIYSIGVGSRGMAPMPVQTPLGRRFVDQPVSIDEALLRRMAEMTGGEYFRAVDERSLRQIYERIDALERTATEERRYLQSSALAVEPVTIEGIRLPPLLLLAVILLGIEMLLAQTRLRSLT